MAILEMKDVSFAYPESPNVIDGVNLCIEPGEFVVIGGASGSGKSTLLRMLKKEVQPVGRLQGEILYDGVKVEHQDAKRLAQEVAMIFQDPENQIVMDEVWQELAFGLENMGYETDVIRKRVAEMVHFFGLDSLLSRKTHGLSGGQKQIMNLAAVLLMQPKVLLLDEPTSQLDPIAAKEFLQMVQRLNEELGMTIVLVEHRLEEVFGLADRIVLMGNGKIQYEGSADTVIRTVWKKQDPHFLLYLPAISKLFLSSSSEGNIPTSVKEGRKWIQQMQWNREEARQAEHSVQRDSPILELQQVDFQYDRLGTPVLSNLSMQVKENDFLVVVGGNGSGKSTLLQVAAGLLKPRRGKVWIGGKKLDRISTKEKYRWIGYLAQNPKLYFIQDSVEKELHHVMRAHELGERELEELVHRLGIGSVLSKHPYDCSGGEQQKIALAGVLLGKPRILLIDEPTKGLDPYSKQEFATILHELREDGHTILMVTHDLEFASSYATKCAMLFQGEITAEGAPQAFFQGNYFYTTVMNRIFRDVQPSALTYEEVVRLWRAHV